MTTEHQDDQRRSGGVPRGRQRAFRTERARLARHQPARRARPRRGAPPRRPGSRRGPARVRRPGRGQRSRARPASTTRPGRRRRAPATTPERTPAWTTPPRHATATRSPTTQRHGSTSARRRRGGRPAGYRPPRAGDPFARPADRAGAAPRRAPDPARRRGARRHRRPRARTPGWRPHRAGPGPARRRAARRRRRHAVGRRPRRGPSARDPVSPTPTWRRCPGRDAGASTAGVGGGHRAPRLERRRRRASVPPS